MRSISGAKGGGSPSTPTESPDSLHSVATARVLDVISEGPIVGLVNGLQSVFLDDTPIQNSDGSTNFSNYSLDYRLGTQDQTFMSGFPAVENEVAVGTPLTSDTPWVHQVENTQLTAIRVRFGLPAFQQSNTSTGDITGYHVDYAIDLATDGGSYSQVLTGAFDGKTTSLYERSIRIELPHAATGWLVRVRRLTANAHSAAIADTINIEAITEIIDRKLRYPMSALIGLTFDAQSFSSVPTCAYDIKGRIIAVPTNYDPATRSYSGTWDGLSFKQAWTDNPAWIFYDLVLNDLYGLGKRVDASMVDVYGLYDIGRYCDVLVSDGKGGQEPRFTCNACIQSQADAYKVLQDLATVFRGIAYWGPGLVVAGSDMPSDPKQIYTAANVLGGAFTYVGSARQTRYTTALVSWNDPAIGYAQAVEPVPDDDGIARYGVVKAQITAFGTTSQGQAHRLGLWTLLTSRYETNTVSFSVGLDGTRCAPGQVIAIADPAKAGRRTGGRIKTTVGNTITLDKAPTAGAGDTLTVILPSGVAQARTVQSVDGDVVAVTAAFDTAPVSGAVWMLESADLASQLFRVVSVQENADDGQITYTVNASQYEPGKYAAIDDGAAIQVRPVTIIPPSVQPPPSNVRLDTYSTIDQGIARTTLVIAWDSADKAVSYIPEWQKDNGEWIPMNAVGGLQAEVHGIYQGGYIARVRAVNALGVTSIPSYSVLTQLTGKTSPPPSVASLTTVSQIFGIDVIWTYPADGSAGDTQRTELWYSRTPARADAVKQSDYAYPQAKASLMGLAAGQVFFFWVRLVDTSGNIGPWYPAGDPGVQGATLTNADGEYNDYFAGVIEKSALGQDLLSEIDLIPVVQAATAANGAAITQEVTDRQAAITAEASARSQSISDEATARANAVAAEALARGTAITTEQNTRSSADSALSTRIDTVTATTGSNVTAIQTEITARTNADSALGTRIDTVVAQTGTNTTAISTETTARTNADSALGSRIDTVVASTGANTTAIQTETTARTNADSALGTRIDTVTASTGANATAISTETTARTNADSALGTRIDNLSTTTNANAAAITAEATARTNADSAQSTRIDTVTATASAKNSTFRQSITPIALAVGDVWVDLGSTNYFKQSNSIGTVAPWSAVGSGYMGTIAASTAIPAPDGTATPVSKVTVNTSTNLCARQTGLSFTPGQATVSTYMYVPSGQTGVTDFRFGVDWNDADVGSVKTYTFFDQWIRVSSTATLTASRNQLDFDITRSAGNLPIGTIFYLAFAQNETGPGAGRYIPTAGAAVSTVGNNQLLVWDGTNWVVSQDAAIPSNTAAISSEATTRATADSALGTRIDSVTASVGDANAAITAEQTARANGDSALGTRIDAINAQVIIPPAAGSTGDYAGSTTIYAGVYSEQSARAEADLALSSSVQTVSAQITSTSTQLIAAVQTETQARVDADSAQASQITNVQAQVTANNNTLTAAVQTNASSYADLNGRVAASYTIKTQVTSAGRTYIAGIGVGVDNSSGVLESTVLLSASRVAIIDPNGSAVTAPFVVQGGQVFISQALIGTAWIGNANIADIIQATAVGANGQPRWKLDKNGTLTMNGANAGSGYLTISDSTVQVYDSAGTLRVRLGLW